MEFNSWKTHTQVEVVLHAVTQDQDTANSVDKGCIEISTRINTRGQMENTYEHQRRSCH